MCSSDLMIRTDTQLESRVFPRMLAMAERAWSQAEFGNSTKNSKFAGTGLGLNIVTKLLNEMNSEIMLTSKIGKGSNFYFEVELETTDQKEIVSQPSSLNTNVAEFTGKKILDRGRCAERDLSQPWHPRRGH